MKKDMILADLLTKFSNDSEIRKVNRKIAKDTKKLKAKQKKLKKYQKEVSNLEDKIAIDEKIKDIYVDLKKSKSETKPPKTRDVIVKSEYYPEESDVQSGTF